MTLVLLVLYGSLLGCRPSAPGFTLVSPEEYRELQSQQSASQAQPQPEGPTLEPKSLDMNAPQIIVEAPMPDIAIQPPLHIQLRFQPAPDAGIDVSSFQVIYKLGLLHKDITDRIVPFVTITPTGLSGVSSSALPAGEHTLILRIRDTMKRLGEQTVTFRVPAE